MVEPNSATPRFDAPPVVETVIGVFFQPIEQFNVVRRAQLWLEVLKDQFPKIEEKATIDDVREVFTEGFVQLTPTVRWENVPPPTRFFAKSADSKHTIQIQQDALISNWERDLKGSDHYLHFGDRLRDFENKLGVLSGFLEQYQLGRIDPTTCFVTYVNHIELSNTSELAKKCEEVFTCWRNETSDNWLPPAEAMALKFSHAMPNKSGRLHVSIVPATRNDNKKPLIRLDLTARGSPKEGTIASAIEWLVLGHEWVTKGFASITRPEMHEQWRRTQ